MKLMTACITIGSRRPPDRFLALPRRRLTKKTETTFMTRAARKPLLRIWISAKLKLVRRLAASIVCLPRR